MKNEILKCKDYQIKKPKRLCKNYNEKKPLAMSIPSNCKIMFISQAPSNKASEKQILNSNENDTFEGLREILDISEIQFNKYIYWTHYGKCYPGKKKGGDQWPTVHCANKFLKDELELCKQRGLKLVIGMSQPTSKYLYCNIIDPDSKISKTKYSKIRNIFHKKYNLQWAFIKHVANTAAWSKNSDDQNFLKNKLRPLINKIINNDY